MRCLHLEQEFDNLGEHDYDHNDVSPATPRYNCIAWAAGENHRRWWPADWDTVTYYWPPHLSREPFGRETLDNFLAAFRSLGYKVCKSPKLENGVEKIAIFATPQHVPTHASRQTETGEWLSKCGVLHEDIKHNTLFAVEGPSGYGKAIKFMKKRRDGKPFLSDRISKFLRWPF